MPIAEILFSCSFPHSPTYDEEAEECTREAANLNNQCLAKRDDKTYLETYNCEYIKTPKPERFARAMVSFILTWRITYVFLRYLKVLPIDFHP